LKDNGNYVFDPLAWVFFWTNPAGDVGPGLVLIHPRVEDLGGD
jgi:hypothetical protein